MRATGDRRAAQLVHDILSCTSILINESQYCCHYNLRRSRVSCLIVAFVQCWTRPVIVSIPLERGGGTELDREAGGRDRAKYGEIGNIDV